jgi:hypothetical protein
MRIKILRTPPIETVDGMDLKRFMAGHQYDVGNQLGSLFLAEGWAEPVPDEEPALVIPFSEAAQFLDRIAGRNPSPPNLVRETYPPYSDRIALAADLERRRRPRRNSRERSTSRRNR